MRLKPLVLLLLISTSFGQNLVPNPSFETITGCPPGNSGISAGYCSSWGVPSGSITTPDLFHSCGTVGTSCSNINVPGNNFGGTSTAYQGSAYSGVMTYYTACANCREYITAPLISSMVAGLTYKIRAWTKLAPLSRYGNNRIGIQISSAMLTQPGGNQPILLTPTVEYPGQILDKTNWTLVQGLYTATGGENRITIGNFYNNGSTSIFDFGSSAGACALVTSGAIYYFDSISVEAVGPLDAAYVSLGASWIEGRYNLSWKGFIQDGFASYEIEADLGGGFTTVSSIDSKDGNETMTWEPPGHLAGENIHFRVRGLGRSGEVLYSNVVEYVAQSIVNEPVFTWFPNPVSSGVTLYTGEGFPGMTIGIYNTSGQCVFSSNTDEGQSMHQWILPEIPAGVYIADVFDGTLHHRQRLLVQ